jgi:hypothetical protein
MEDVARFSRNKNTDKSPSSYKLQQQKALVADLEETFADDPNRDSPKSLIPANKPNGYNRYIDGTPRSVDSMDSQANDRGGLFPDSRDAAPKSGSRWSRSGPPKVPALWNHGETPRSDTVTSHPSNSQQNPDFPGVKSPVWTHQDPKSTPPTTWAVTAGHGRAEAGGAGKPPDGHALAPLLQAGFRPDEQSPQSGSLSISGAAPPRQAPAEPPYPSDVGARSITISPMEEVAVHANGPLAASSAWAPPADAAAAPATALRHSASSSFIPIRAASAAAAAPPQPPRPPPPAEPAAPAGAAARGGEGERRARALSDPARGHWYLEEYKAASTDLHVANATLEVQRQLIAKLEAR